MKIEKDVLVAIIVGVVIGGLTAFFILFLPKHFPKTGQSEDRGEPFKEEATASPAATYPLTIESPKEEEVLSEEKITVSGKSTPKALIAILSPVDENITEANDEGHFQAEIFLEEGINEINITSYSDETEETQTVTVYYTEEEI